MSESTYKTEGSRVYGQGNSYNCTNIVTAKELCTQLNNYETIKKQTLKTEQKLDKIQKGVIQLQMTLKILQSDLDKIKKELDI